jgi:hypothetical protein
MAGWSSKHAARCPAGPYSGGDDRRERKKKETVTRAAELEEGYLKEKTREGGSKGGEEGTVATALGAAEDL